MLWKNILPEFTAALTPVSRHTVCLPYYTCAVKDGRCLTLEKSVCLMKNLISNNMLLANTDTHAPLLHRLIPESHLPLFIVDTSARGVVI